MINFLKNLFKTNNKKSNTNIIKNCMNCKFNDGYNCTVGTYYANKGINTNCIEGELWQNKKMNKNIDNNNSFLYTSFLQNL